MTTSLSVVMPVYNEASDLPRTIEALVQSLAGSELQAELVVVDDGSSDGSGEAARDATGSRLPVRVLRQPNRGRFAARRAGVEAAAGDWVLLLDGRVRLHPDSLRFVAGRLERGDRVWTGHVEVVSNGNLFGIFWSLLAELAWAEYFRRPRTTSFGSDDFDRYPKGTGCFVAPRSVLLAAIRSFRSRYSDQRRVNDDAPLIRWIAERERIHVSPQFACDYRPRLAARSFVRHSYHRGFVFLDGHGRRESRFFPVVASFYPVSALLAVAALRRPVLVPLAAAGTSAAAAAVGILHGRKGVEVASLALLAPVYAVAHGAGMWRGLASVVGGALRTR